MGQPMCLVNIIGRLPLYDPIGHDRVYMMFKLMLILDAFVPNCYCWPIEWLSTHFHIKLIKDDHLSLANFNISPWLHLFIHIFEYTLAHINYCTSQQGRSIRPFKIRMVPLFFIISFIYLMMI